MYYNESEVLDLSLPRKRPSTTSSPSPPPPPPAPHRPLQYEHNIKDDFGPSIAKRQKNFPQSSARDELRDAVYDTSSDTTESPADHYADEILAFPDGNMTSYGSMKRSCGNVSVCLHDDRLWRDFMELGTEMIINRSGRRMFPHVVLSVQGLDADTYYSVIMEIVPADNGRYKYVHNQWVSIGTEDPGRDIQAVTHLESSSSGAHWMKNKISFSKVRLTNSKESSAKESTEGNILLLSMHKYMVVIKIRNDITNAVMKFVFQESVFFAVTAYQNNKITQLKIKNNPFAKAFREAPSPSSVDSSKHSTKGRCVKDICEDVKPKKIRSSYVTEGVGKSHSPIDVPHGIFVQQMAFDQLYKAALQRSLQPPSYFPWYAMGSPFPYQYWSKDSNCTPQFLSLDNNTRRLPVDMGQPPTYFQSQSTTLHHENTCGDNNTSTLDEQQSQSVK